MNDKPSQNAFAQAASQQPAETPGGDPSPGSHRGHSFGLHHEDRSAGHPSGQHSKPTKGSLKDRQGSPSGAGYTTSGVDRAMQQLADREHRRVFKGRK